MKKIICIFLLLFSTLYAHAQCNHTPGTMSKDTVLVCVPPDTVTFKNNNDQVLLPTDALMYVVHNAPGTTLGTTFGTSVTGFFNFNGMGLDTCQLYYVSAVVGKKLPNGQVDLSDTCLEVAKGTPFFRKNNASSILISVTTVAACPPLVVCGSSGSIEACPPINPVIIFPPLPANVCPLSPTRWDTIPIKLGGVKDTGVWSIKEYPNALVKKDTIFIPGYKILFGNIHNKKTTIEAIPLIKPILDTLKLSFTARFHWLLGSNGNANDTTYKIPVKKSCGGGYIFDIDRYSDVPVTMDKFVAYSSSTTICPGQYAQVYIDIISGSPSFTYSWSNGSTKSSISFFWFGPGTYFESCVVTDANGCSASAIYIINVTSPTPPIFKKVEPTCGQNNGSISIENAFLYYNVSWSNGASTSTINNLAAGFYSVTASSGGCATQGSITIENQVKTISKTQTSLTCDANNLKSDTSFLKTNYGCDSLFIVNKILKNKSFGSKFINTCDANNLKSDTTFLKNNYGCDSLFVVNKILKNKSFASKFVNTCDANNLKSDTTFLKNNYGCDSLFVVNKILKNKSFGSKFINTCDANNLKSDTTFLKNNYGCDSLFVVNKILKNKSFASKFINTCDANNLKPDSTFLKNNYGCDSLFVVNKILKKSQSSFKNIFTCNALQIKTDSILFKNTYGCDSFLIINTLLKQSAVNANLVMANKISCYDAKNGSLSIENLQGGQVPYQFFWSNGGTSQKIDKLAAGAYTLTISDAEQCTFTQNFVMKSPDKVTLKVLERKPLCSTDDFGAINLTEVNGGTGNFWYQMDKKQAKKINILPVNLSSIGIGNHEISVFDDNNCTANYNFVYSKPSVLGLNLEIEKDIITLGDSALLKLKTNFVANKISWKPSENLSCDTCLATFAYPKENTTYEVTASDSNGCEVKTNLALTVKYVKNVYVPNVFNPEGRSNSMFTIYGDPLIVKRIVSFRIYDRWGTLIHENYDFAPNLGSWDGSFRGEPCNSAVFVYYGDIEYYDGTVKRLVGDVTLIRR